MEEMEDKKSSVRTITEETADRRKAKTQERMLLLKIAMILLKECPAAGTLYVMKRFMCGECEKACAEFMWVRVHHIDLEGELVKGYLQNEPVLVKSVMLGDPVTVAFDEFEDCEFEPAGETP